MRLTLTHRSRIALAALALGGGLLTAGAAAAQQAAPAAPAAAAPAAPEPTPGALAAARDVVESSGMSRSFRPMVPELMKQIVPTITRTHPELQKDLSDTVKQLEPEFLKAGDNMTDIAARIYARRMSEDELKQTAAFFKTPAGMKYVQTQPQMLDELVVAMQSWTQQLSGMMMNRVRDEMEKKGKSIL